MVYVTGTVFTGQGEGKHFLQLPVYKQFFSKLLNDDIFPGTLNIRLSKKWHTIEGWKSYKPENYGKVYYRHGKIHTDTCDIPVILLRPLLTSYEEDVIEIVAKEKLREKLNLCDNDTVLLTL